MWAFFFDFMDDSLGLATGLGGRGSISPVSGGAFFGAAFEGLAREIAGAVVVVDVDDAHLCFVLKLLGF